MTRPRVVATDLDGTVVRSDHTVSERTVAAFARVERAGAVLVLVTGRPPRWMRPVADAVAHRGLAICANGAIVYDLHTEQVVDTHLIPVDALRTAVEVLGEALPGLGFAVENGDGLAYADGFPLSYWDSRTPRTPVPIDELVARPAAKLLARHPELAADALLAEAVKLVGGVVLPTHSNGDRLIEISALGVSKASTLAELCTRHGVDAADVVAFGDMPNDLPMLNWAGRAYAVANAHPEVLAAVDHKVAANDEDGVARMIEELFPEDQARVTG
ncbi:HAD family hydrolase [Actinoallomurus purpureus]|uniref:HAD family hydrolase n=1 Tax=Actinoallomurus purpureus TaxID=478114 RepID=UPI0020924FF2|nr:HAD family hydrolase [Actinoallomurus purpureus]MCO6007428.1 HAD family hydrolase [Actinoallomurus purpureus]